MNHSTLQFPDLFIATTSSTATTTTSYPPPPPLSPSHQQQAKEYVDQRIIPHRLQIGLGIHNGAHGSLYKCHTLYLEYKSLLQQLQQRHEQQQQQQEEEEQQPLRLLLQRTQRQLITELRLQQLEFQKLVMLQQSRRDEIIALQQRNKEENSNSMDVVILSVVPNHTNTNHNNKDHDDPTNAALLSSLQQLRQRFHHVQQLNSCYQEYDAILQVLYASSSDGKLPTNSSTLNLSTTTTTAMSMPPPPPPPQQQQQQQLSSLVLRNGNNSNEILQSTYDALVRDKQMIQDQIFNIQRQEIQLRKQQLHLLQQTIQDMKHQLYVPMIQE